VGFIIIFNGHFPTMSDGIIPIEYSPKCLSQHTWTHAKQQNRCVSDNMALKVRVGRHFFKFLFVKSISVLTFSLPNHRFNPPKGYQKPIPSVEICNLIPFTYMNLSFIVLFSKKNSFEFPFSTKSTPLRRHLSLIIKFHFWASGTKYCSSQHNGKWSFRPQENV